MFAYSMEEATKVIDYSCGWNIASRPESPDYPAFAALCEVCFDVMRMPPLMALGTALSLGEAIGKRKERARRRGEDFKQLPYSCTRSTVQAVDRVRGRHL